MALVNSRPGARVTISIGRRGEKPDMFPARIAGNPVTIVDNGRPGVFVPVITAQHNLAGEEYLGERLHNVQFAFDRTELNLLLDGPAQQPKTIQELIAEKQAATMAYLNSRPDTAALDLSTVSTD